MFASDGRVTAPELPMIAAPAACVDACRTAKHAIGAITIVIAITRARTGSAANAMATPAAASAGPSHTGHERNTPAAQTAASHSSRCRPARVQFTIASTSAIANVSDSTWAKKKNWKSRCGWQSMKSFNASK